MATDTIHWIILIFTILTFLIVLFGTFRGWPHP